ncbi:inositol monophosphatase family protein [Actinomadura livida]|uniref:Inositol-1-monophosphatase n=1 Tax=Actinomadura livida TaxID=79909 RepID=A0A7W7MXM8_9ACTN|nr:MULTISPECIES: inositol monophosphatase family protein [Actinomadura]MBB4774049.1 myo-inositol-1(or 4)-monophosphatase [Actinomadura catellatispora]GGT85228.1 fructose-1,6-bisphosphatase [Actinomadura livida]
MSAASTPDLAAELLELAAATAREAGRMLIDKRPLDGPDVVQTKSSPTDVVTQMDRAAEQLIIERIRAVRPDDAFLGEEGGARDGGSGVRWVVDPIDGTVNYLYDLPDWAVSIAAEVDGTTVAGAVDMPRRGETCTAVRGGGALLHTASGTRELRVNAGVPLGEALVATGFGYDAGRRAGQARVLTGVLPGVRDIRRGGSCCVDLCSLAVGRVDAYYERGVQAWDVAAGALIVQEAGGRVEGLHGAPASPELTIAAGPGTFEALHELLVPLDPLTD